MSVSTSESMYSEACRMLSTYLILPCSPLSLGSSSAEPLIVARGERRSWAMESIMSFLDWRSSCFSVLEDSSLR